MPAVDSQGNEIPGSFTQAEVEARIAEATKDSADKVENLQKQLDENKDKMANLEEGNKDWRELRKINDQLSKKITELQDGIAPQIQKALEPIIGDLKGEMINKLANGDENLKKKIEKNWDDINTPARTKEEIKEKAIKAYKMSVDEIKPSIINGIISNVPNGGDYTPGSVNNTIDPELLDAGRMFGLTADDFKKYTPKNVGVMTEAEKKFKSA